jgi:dolichol kinase
MGLTPWYRTEVSRKVFHLFSALTPLLYLWAINTGDTQRDRKIALSILAILTLVAVSIEVARHLVPAFGALFRRVVGFMVRDAEFGRVTGATYVLVGGLLTIWLFPKPVAVAVLLVATFADAAASLVGINFGRSKFLGKSPAGSFAFFLTALAVLWLTLPHMKGVAFAAAIFATFVEALPSLKIGKVELNDNLMIPLLTGALISLLRSDAGPIELAAALSNTPY